MTLFLQSTVLVTEQADHEVREAQSLEPADIRTLRLEFSGEFLTSSEHLGEFDPVEAAAWTGVSSVLLNLHEFITRD